MACDRISTASMVKRSPSQCSVFVIDSSTSNSFRECRSPGFSGTLGIVDLAPAFGDTLLFVSLRQPFVMGGPKRGMH